MRWLLEGICPECMLKAGLASQTDADQTGPHGTKVTPLPPPKPDEIAPLFPHLEILECLGRGGMGAVYKARQPKLNRLVALKILAPEKGKDPKFADRFLREAQALAHLNHQNIVTIHDFGETGGLCYLLMEFVDGLSLRQLIQTRKLTPEQALSIVPRICDALQFAHEQGIVHRDIKPENILLDKHGRVKIADFGIAKMMGTDTTFPFGVPSSSGPDRLKPGLQNLTEAGKVIGTPHYMAPEQIEKPATVDHRADIYSLGVVFYEMLTGELPLGKFATPSQMVQVDVRLDEVVLRALEKEPDRRYQQASVFKTQVETIAADTGKSEVRPVLRSTTAEGGSPKSEVKARFSRTAIWGVAWAALFFVNGILAYTPPGWTITAALRDSIGNVATGLLVSGPLMLLGFAAPIGATALGIVALYQIRRLRCRGTGLALFDVLLFPLLILNCWMIWLARNVMSHLGSTDSLSGGLPGWAVAAFVLLAVAVNGLVIRQAWRMANKFVNSPPPSVPATTAVSDEPLRKSISRALVRAALVVIVQLCLLETILQASVHRPESYGEIRYMALFSGSLAAMAWAAWPLRRRRYTVLLRAGAALVLFAGLCMLDAVYSNHLRPNLGLYEEDDWVAQHPGFQWGWRQSIGKNVWDKPIVSAFAPEVEMVLPLDERNVTLLDLDIGRQVNREGFDTSDEEAKAWARSKDLDVAAIPKNGQIKVCGLALKAAWVPHMALRKPIVPQQVVNFWVLDRKPPKETVDLEIPTNMVGTLVIRTCEGSMGLLEFLGKSESPPSVKIRYKLVQTSEATTSAPAKRATTVSSPSFGPVVERVMTQMMAIDFDTDKITTLGLDQNGQLRDIYYWPVDDMQKQGLDIILNVTLSSLRLGDTKLMSLDEESWERSNPVQFKQTIQSIDWAHQKLSPSIEVRTNGPATYGFLTREGGVGLLQINGFTERPRGVKIRYKLMQSTATIPAPPGYRQGQEVFSPPGYQEGQPVPLPPGYERGREVPPPPAYRQAQNQATKPVASTVGQEFSFGPVIERTVSRDRFLDLESGEVLNAPPSVIKWIGMENWTDRYSDEESDSLQTRAWVRGSGADLLAREDSEGLVLFDGYSVASFSDTGRPQSGDDDWRFTVSQIVELMNDFEKRMSRKIVLPSLVDTTMRGGKEELPKSFLFKTRESSMGVLQIIGLTDNPPGVKIRYKLVQSRESVAEATETPSPATPAYLQSRTARANDIRQVLLAANMYADANKGEWPASLSDLEQNLGRSFIENVSASLEYYRPKHIIAPTNGQIDAYANPVLFEKKAVSTNGEWVGCADGHLVFVKNAAKLRELRASVQEAGPSGQQHAKPQIPELEFRLVAAQGDTRSPADELADPNDRSGNRKLRVLKEVQLDGSAVRRAGWQSSPDATMGISVELTEPGRRKFAELTRTNVGRQLAIVLDGRVLTAPVIRSQINSPTVNLSGNWKGEELTRIVTGLNRGLADEVTFSETCEYVLRQVTNSGAAIFLGLESRRLTTNQGFSPDTREFHDWTRRLDVDASGGPDTRQLHSWLKQHNPGAAAAEGEPLPIVLCYDMVVVPAETNAWNSSSAAEVNSQWQLMTQETEKETAVGRKAGVTDTFYFRTRNDVRGLLQVLSFSDNPRGVKIRYKLVEGNNSQSSSNFNLGRMANIHSAQGKVVMEMPQGTLTADSISLGSNQTMIATGIKLVTRAVQEQAVVPADLREARAKLAELRVNYDENHLEVQKALARVKELERMSKEGPNAPADLREAKAHLAELRVDYTERHPEIQKATARVRALSAELEFRLVATEGDIRTPADELADPNDRTGQTKLRILKEVLLDSSAVASASLETNQNQSPLDAENKTLSITLKSDAVRKFSDITRTNLNRRLAIVWRGRVLSAPVIRAQITGPAVSVTGRLNDAECLVLLDLLNYKPGDTVSPRP